MEHNINSYIEEIKRSEGEAFTSDLKKIENEYLAQQTENSGLAIKILSIFGGILSVIAFIVALFIAGLYDSEIGLIITGILLIAASLWINIKNTILFVDTICISAYLTGLFLIAFGLDNLDVDENTITIIFQLLAVITVFITFRYLLTFISVLVINAGFLFLIINTRSYQMIHFYNAVILIAVTFLILKEARILSDFKLFSKIYNSVRTALIISLISGLFFEGKKGIFYFYFNHWVLSLVTIPLSLFIVSKIIKILNINSLKYKIVIYVLCILILIATIPSPAITSSLLIILLGFMVNYKTGMTIGILSFIYFIAQYYYDLQYTLLTKSVLMFVSGLVFLLFYYIIHKILDQNEKV